LSLKKIRFRFVIIVVCSLLCNLSVHAKKTGANKKSKKPIKLEKLNLTPEQIEKDKRIREKHSENAVKEYKALEYMKLKPITIKFSLGFITDKYDRNAKSNIWEHNSFKSPIINLGFYMNNFFSYGRLHLFYGADISYLESTEEIADGRVELKTVVWLFGLT